MKKVAIVIALASAILISGCQTTGPRESVGGILGAGIGVLLGSQIGGGSGQTAAMVILGLTGAVIGSEIGRGLDAMDRQLIGETSLRTLERVPSGNTSRWRNPDSGNYGTFTPTRTYRTRGTYCREYQTTVTVGGRTVNGYGTACRQPDGSWKIRR